jgi:hypothetical protein
LAHGFSHGTRSGQRSHEQAEATVSLERSDRPPYSPLIRAIGEQARDLYPNASWDEVSRELEQLWRSYVTGLSWAEVADKIRGAWEDADPRNERH